MSYYRSVVLADTPVAYWALDEAAGSTNAADLTGNANTAAKSANGVTFGVTGAATGTATGVTLDDDNGGQLQASNSTSLNSPAGAVSIEAWVKPETGHFGSQKMVVSKSYTSHVSPYYQYCLAMSDAASSKTISFWVCAAGSAKSLVVNSSGWTYGAWHHIVGTWDGTTSRIYRNGNQVGEKANSGGNISQYNTSLTIGGYGTLAANATNNFAGDIDEIAIYDSALSAARVAAHYAAASVVLPDLGTGHLVVHGGGMGVPRYFSAAPALRGPVAYGPAVTQTGMAVPDVAARLYRRADLLTAVAQLDGAYGRQWINQHNEPGSGSLTLPSGDTDLASLGDTDVVRFEYKGHAALSILVRERTVTTIDAGEEANQATTLSGCGSLGILDEALVYPSRGADSLPIEEDRGFNWTSFDYDDSAWGTATEISLVKPGSGGGDPGGSQTDPREWWLNVANVWPNGITKWIWGPSGTATDAPVGFVYVRQTFYLADQQNIVVYGAADNLLRLWIDGQELTFNNPETWNFGKQRIGPLSAGWHTIAASGEDTVNIPGAPNPGGIAITVYLVDDLGNEAANPTLWTDRNWKLVEYPPGGPPGMTPGEVIRHVVTEAQMRGGLPGLTLAFDDDVDSDGAPWPVVADIATKVGTDVLTFIRELCGTYIDVSMSPGEWRLWAWNKGGAGRDTNVTFHAPTDAFDPASGNLGALTHRRVI